MAKIKPFCAIRPKEGLEKQIAALPYDVYNRTEAKEIVKKEPLSFLNIDRAETQFQDDVNIYADCVYEKANELLWNMIRDGKFIKEKTSCYYVYELTMNQRSQTGLVACASVDDYLEETIKKHENTRADKELDRINHVDICNAQTGPIFLAYHGNEIIRQKIQHVKTTKPVYDFIAEDGIGHRVWIMDNQNDMKEIEEAFVQIQSIYIADGHHRCASAVKVALKRRETMGNYSGEEAFNYFLSVLFPDEELLIMDYNRVVLDLNGLSKEDFLEKLESVCYVRLQEELHVESRKPRFKNQVSMYLDKKWYTLEFYDKFTVTDPVENLDVSKLQNLILNPMLGIQDPKTDKRIDFVGGIRGLAELEKRVERDAKVAFAMYPTSIQELFEVSDAGKLMPPKSTWFEPKLRSGLFIHSIK